MELAGGEQARDSKDRLFQFWNESEAYREYGKTAGLQECPFRKSLPRILEGRRSILDLACGDGNNLPFLPEGVDYVGCDCSDLALARLMERDDHPPMTKRVHACDVYTLPVPDASRDAVISSYSFEHFLDVPRILDECDRVLRPGGLLVIFGPDFTQMNNYGPPQRGREARNRLALYSYAASRMARRGRYGLGRDRVLFEYIDPLPLDDETFVPDHDMTHLTSHATIAKFLAARGYEPLGLERARPPSGSFARRLLGTGGLWGGGGDVLLTLRKATGAVRPRPVKVTQRLISRQR